MVVMLSKDPAVIGRAPTVARLIAATFALTAVAAKRPSLPLTQVPVGADVFLNSLLAGLTLPKSAVTSTVIGSGAFCTTTLPI